MTAGTRIAIIVGLLLAAAIMFSLGDSLTPCDHRLQGQLQLLQGELQAVKAQLLDYHRAHGRYPSNDEGLAALDNFQSRFKAVVFVRPYDAEGYGGLWPEWNDASYDWAADVRLFREHHGRAPSKPGDLVALTAMASEHDPDFKPVEVDLAIGRDDHIFLMTDAGILSPWLVPYVYENCQGLGPAAFADSPAPRGLAERYSVRVDDGVYVYSVGGRLCAEELAPITWRRTVVALIVLLLFGAALLFVLLSFRASARAGIAALTTLLVATCGWFFLCFVVLAHPCMLWPPRFYHRDPRMLTEQRQLLEKYHSRGVLSDASYRRALSAIEFPPPAKEEQDASPGPR